MKRGDLLSESDLTAVCDPRTTAVLPFNSSATAVETMKQDQRSDAGNAFPSYMHVFVSDKYRNCAMLPPMEASEAAVYQRLQAIRSFFQEGCTVRSLIMGAGGGVLGLLFGTFFFTMKPVDIDTSKPLRDQIRQSYRGFVPEVTKTAKGFAKLGFLYSIFDCTIARVRKRWLILRGT